MAYSTVPKTKRDGTITLIDGTTPAAVELEVAYEDGNLSIDIPKQFGSLIIRDRGDTVAVRKQDDQQVTGTFSFHLRQFTDGSEAGSIIDFIEKAGFYSGNTSTGASGVPYIEEYAIDIKYEVAGTVHGDDANHTATLSKCLIDSYSVAEGDPSNVTLNFTCFGGHTYTGPA